MILLILGAGGHGYVVKEVAEALGSYSKIVFLDDSSLQAIGKLSDYEKYRDEFTYAFVAIGNSALRKQWQVCLFTVGYRLSVLIHPRAVVSDRVAIGEGSVVMAVAIVQSNVKIGAGCIISAGES